MSDATSSCRPARPQSGLGLPAPFEDARAGPLSASAARSRDGFKKTGVLQEQRAEVEAEAGSRGLDSTASGRRAGPRPDRRRSCAPARRARCTPRPRLIRRERRVEVLPASFRTALRQENFRATRLRSFGPGSPRAPVLLRLLRLLSASHADARRRAPRLDPRSSRGCRRRPLRPEPARRVASPIRAGVGGEIWGASALRSSTAPPRAGRRANAPRRAEVGRRSPGAGADRVGESFSARLVALPRADRGAPK